MTWFGWLLKGHYEVSLLDRVVFVGELAVGIMLFVLVWHSYDVGKRCLKSRRRKEVK